MKTTFHRNRRRKVIKKFIILGIVVALVFFVFKNQPVNHLISNKISTIIRPFLKLGNEAKEWLNINFVIFKEKKILEQENSNLKNKIMELETKQLSCELLEKENYQLKEIFSRAGDKKYLLSLILSKPPQSPYDILLIDAGSANGIRKGMPVTAYGDVLIGYIDEVFSKTSKVKLISFPKEETNALISSLNIPVIVIGRGGANMEIILSKSIEIQPGEKIISLDITPLLLGIIEKIESGPPDPFQKLLFRLPVNIQELKYVMIEI